MTAKSPVMYAFKAFILWAAMLCRAGRRPVQSVLSCAAEGRVPIAECRHQ